jgi:hypothetical protein
MPGKYADDEERRQFVANLKRMREALGWSQERLVRDTADRAGAVLAL